MQQKKISEHISYITTNHIFVFLFKASSKKSWGRGRKKKEGREGAREGGKKGGREKKEKGRREGGKGKYFKRYTLQWSRILACRGD